MYKKAIELLESMVNKYLMGNITKVDFLNNFIDILNSIEFTEGDKKFKAYITEHKSEEFFGIRLLPDIAEAEELCEYVVKEGDSLTFPNLEKEWVRISNWVFELDSLLFDRTVINLTPIEIVAMIIHEIGHIIYSDEPIETFYTTYRESKRHLKKANTLTQKLMYPIYVIPLSIACMQKRWLTTTDKLYMEINSNTTIKDNNLYEPLLDAVNRVVRTFGNTHTSMNDYYNHVESSMIWCILNIRDVVKRRENLRDELYYIGIRTNSTYIKMASVRILEMLGFKLREKYSGAVIEATVGLLSDNTLLNTHEFYLDSKAFDSFYSAYNLFRQRGESLVATEGFLSGPKKLKVELPSQYEVDAISVEIDKITNHHDRIFVLDLIYNILEKVEYFEEVVEKNPILARKWASKIESMKAELNSLRIATLNKKKLDKSYRFFVQYPEGYEG